MDSFFDLNTINIGDRIWRPVHLIPSQPSPSKTILKVVFKKTEKGSFMCWIYKSMDIVDKFQWYAQDYGKGMVCFLKEEPHKDWTCLEVTGKSKNGKAVFAKALIGTKEELLKAYDLRSPA